jgi:hypothetical protein
MKTQQRGLDALLVVVSIALLCPGIFAQNRSQWPSALNQRSSVLEILNWLDKTSFPHARVGVKTSSDSGTDSDSLSSLSPVTRQDARPPDSLFYSQGFKLIKVDGCTVTLKNDDTTLIAHSRLIQDQTPQQHYRAELYVPLYRLSYKKGRVSYRHTNNSEKSRLLGTWRTEFKSNRSREEALLTLFLPGHTEKLVVWEGEILTFTFDTREMSEQFDAAFRQAIRLCQTK